MATNAAYAATPHVGAILTPATLDTSLTAPTNTSNVFTAGANGSRVDIIRIMQVVSVAAAGVLNLFLYDGTTHHLFDQYTYGVVALSTTSESNPIELYYPKLLVPNVSSTAWIIRSTVTTSAGQSAFKVIAFGGDF